eukprot:m51a1_g6773 putative multiple inositol polyphosphate phosphatase 1-like (486) ;mRNA; r:118558-120158
MHPEILLALGLLCAVRAADLTQYFGTTRPYVYNNGVPQAPLDGCNVSGVYYVSRHGSRYPTSDLFEGIVTLTSFLEKQRHVVAGTGQWIAGWKSQFDTADEGGLSELGATDLEAIGERFAKHFPTLLFPYTPNAVHTQSTGKPRTAQTAAAFTVGVVGNMTQWALRPWVAVSESKTADKLLRFFDACPKYVQTVKKNTNAKSVQAAFLKIEMPAIAKKVAAMTNISADDLVSAGVLPVMWEMCTFETTVLGSSKWCSLFDEEDAKVFEYSGDLDKYYTSGYGIDVAYKNAAPLLQDIFKYFDAVIAGTSGTPRAKLMFAHAETTFPLKALLGMNKDATPLGATWTKEQREARKWRASTICTMASNVGFVVSKCSSGAHQIQMLESETPVDFPNVAGCKSNWCPLTAVREANKEALGIDFSSLCSNAASGSSSHATHSSSHAVHSSSHAAHSSVPVKSSEKKSDEKASVGARAAVSALLLAALLRL